MNCLQSIHNFHVTNVYIKQSVNNIYLYLIWCPLRLPRYVCMQYILVHIFSQKSICIWSKIISKLTSSSMRRPFTQRLIDTNTSKPKRITSTMQHCELKSVYHSWLLQYQIQLWFKILKSQQEQKAPTSYCTSYIYRFISRH